MKEDFLHYLWKFKKFQTNTLKTQIGEPIEIVSVGEHNFNSGPDFFNAKLKIGIQLWAGNVEIHVKSSDWFLHNHEQDKAYDNVILHVVWEHDTEIFRKDNTVIPTLQLKDFIADNVLNNYQKLFNKKHTWINCETEFASVDDFLIKNWLERLYFERLEQKSETIQALLQASQNDWEAVLFKMLTKNFGLKVNGDSFFSLANSIDFSVIRKTQNNLETLEALLFGQAGFLNDDFQDLYYLGLVKEYAFLKQKFKLENNHVLPMQFFRLRPPNFPTIRISQLSSLYYKHQNLFSKIIEINTLQGFYDLFKVSTTAHWETHYTFQKVSKASTKLLTKSFVDLLLINTIIPLKFCYAKQKGENIDELILSLGTTIQSEKNSIINAFNDLIKVSNSALDSQALIQLKTHYCDKNRCLKCAVGNSIISQNF
ncbi:MAG: DUF2851 family protein [Flaviramulus sp.]|nr:DUF2851 family protein [Flaviramulus sp.]